MPTYLVVIENAAHNFSAYSPDVPGCTATGKSIAETVKEMKSALEFHLEEMDVKPQPMGLNHYMNDDSFKKDSTDYVLQIELN